MVLRPRWAPRPESARSPQDVPRLLSEVMSHQHIGAGQAASAVRPQQVPSPQEQSTNYRTPIPELVRMADLLEAEFPGPSPCEDLRGSLDGDFLYLTMNYAEGPGVEAFLARNASALGLVVYSPLSEDYVAAWSLRSSDRQDAAPGRRLAPADSWGPTNTKVPSRDEVPT